MLFMGNLASALIIYSDFISTSSIINIYTYNEDRFGLLAIMTVDHLSRVMLSTAPQHRFLLAEGKH